MGKLTPDGTVRIEMENRCAEVCANKRVSVRNAV